MMSLHIDSTPLPYTLLLKNLCNVPLINSVIHIFPVVVTLTPKDITK